MRKSYSRAGKSVWGRFLLVLFVAALVGLCVYWAMSGVQKSGKKVPPGNEIVAMREQIDAMQIKLDTSSARLQKLQKRVDALETLPTETKTPARATPTPSAGQETVDDDAASILMQALGNSNGKASVITAQVTKMEADESGVWLTCVPCRYFIGEEAVNAYYGAGSGHEPADFGMEESIGASKRYQVRNVSRIEDPFPIVGFFDGPALSRRDSLLVFNEISTLYSDHFIITLVDEQITGLIGFSTP